MPQSSKVLICQWEGTIGGEILDKVDPESKLIFVREEIADNDVVGLGNLFSTLKSYLNKLL